MNLKMIFREANLRDKGAIYSLANQLHERIQVDWSVFDDAFTGLLLSENHFVLVAEYNKEIVGYLSAYWHFAIYNNGNVMFVDEIVVHNSKRGDHIGSGLMNYLEKKAQEHYCSMIALVTSGAGGFYNTLGYDAKAEYYKKYI